MKAVPLGELVLDMSPGFASGDDLDDGVFQIRMNNVTRDGRIVLDERRRVSADNKAIDKALLEPGDILFNATNSVDLVGKTGLFRGADEPAVYSNHFIRVRTDPDLLDAGYLSRWLQSRYEKGYFGAKAKRWVNQATFGQDRLREVAVPLPPIAEQRRVAAILDAADELSVKRREALDCLESLPQSIFSEMFGDPVSNPMDWRMATLSDVVAEGTTVTYGIVQAGPEFDGGVPYIRTGDIVAGQIANTGMRHTAPDVAARSPRSRVRSGEIVMSIRATVGTTALVPQELDGANLTQGTARIAPGPDTEGAFLLEHLRSGGTQHWIARQVKGATFREITLGRLRELPVMLPPLDLQCEYSLRIAAVSELGNRLDRSARELESLSAAGAQLAFRGEL